MLELGDEFNILRIEEINQNNEIKLNIWDYDEIGDKFITIAEAKQIIEFLQNQIKEN